MDAGFLNHQTGSFPHFLGGKLGSQGEIPIGPMPTQAQQSFPALPPKPLSDQGSKAGETWREGFAERMSKTGTEVRMDQWLGSLR